MLPAEIHTIRQSRGWSLEEMARRLGVSYQTLWRWEAGKYCPADSKHVRTLKRWAREDERKKVKG